MSALKQQQTDIPYFCKRCREMLSSGQMVCPFCDNDATPVDELTAASSAFLEAWADGGDDARLAPLAITLSNALNSALGHTETPNE